MKLRSRLSGREDVLLAGAVVPSEFEVIGSSLRVVPEGLDLATQPDFLGRWPDAVDLQAVERVVEPLVGDASWSMLAGTLPLVPKIDATACLNELDRFIVRLLPNLQHVCHRPRLHLKLEEERLPISRARRFPERATAVLASHPEDWEHRTLRSVRPSRVLATQAEDLWDLYENRVAVRLVDHLLKYVSGRVDRLQRLQEMYDEGADFQDETRGSYRRGERLFRLWGTFFDDNALARELAESLRALETVQHHLRALLDSPLYREIPRKSTVSLTLRSTNILVNDAHYRKVADLWREWARRGHVAQLTRDELRKQRQAQARAFDVFVRLVAVRALTELGFSPEDVARRLRSSRHDAAVSVGADGTITLTACGRHVRVVPLLAQFSHGDLPELWARLSAAGETVVVAILGRPQDFRSDNEVVRRAFEGWETPRIVAVSPWSIDSVERMARVLGSWIADAAARAFPARRVVQPDAGVPLPNWLRRKGDEVLALMPASESELAAFRSACARRRQQLDGEEARARVVRRRFDPSQRNALGPLLEAADEAVALNRLARCPVCSSDAGARFEPRADGGVVPTWWCACDDCGAEWGTRACTACRSSYPVLLPLVSAYRASSGTPGWIDRIYGRDVWSEPCWRPDRPATFRCPRCSSCAGGSCMRCAPLGASVTPAVLPTDSVEA